MKLINKPYFDSRLWILDNLEKLNINTSEIALVLVIQYCNQFNIYIDYDLLANKTKIKKNAIDEILTGLIQKGYLAINANDKGLVFDISGLFEEKDTYDSDISVNMIERFETEFNRTLTNKEISSIKLWLTKYEYKIITNALKEAIASNNLRLEFISKLLKHWEDNGLITVSSKKV